MPPYTDLPPRVLRMAGCKRREGPGQMSSPHTVYLTLKHSLPVVRPLLLEQEPMEEQEGLVSSLLGPQHLHTTGTQRMSVENGTGAKKKATCPVLNSKEVTRQAAFYLR